MGVIDPEANSDLRVQQQTLAFLLGDIYRLL